jgi:hypothetical protein
MAVAPHFARGREDGAAMTVLSSSSYHDESNDKYNLLYC